MKHDSEEYKTSKNMVEAFSSVGYPVLTRKISKSYDQFVQVYRILKNSECKEKTTGENPFIFHWLNETDV